MKKIAFFLFICVYGTIASAQSPIVKDIFEFNNSNYPKNMPKVKQWVEDTFKDVFVSGVEFSQSYLHDNTFYSFSLVNRNPKPLIFPKTDGFKFVPDSAGTTRRGIKTQRYRIECRKDIIAYKIAPKFDLTYSLKEYFDYTKSVLRINDTELIANTLNLMVEPQGQKTKFQQLIDDVNRKMKLKLPYSKEDSLKDLVAVLKSSGISSNDIVYETYIANKKKEVAEQNLDRFYTVARRGDDVISAIDKLRTYVYKIGMDKPETIEIPLKYMSPFSNVSKDSISKFEFTHLEAVLDFKLQSLTIHFFGNLNEPALFKDASIQKYNHKKKKSTWAKVKSQKKGIDVYELIFEVSEKKMRIEATGQDGKYQIVENKM